MQRDADGLGRRAGSPIRLSEFARLRALMDRLRDPGGCPWDRAQGLPELRAHVLEEAYEVAEAIDRQDHTQLKEELGDLLLQVVFLARIESEAGRFDVEDVIGALHDKLVRRHPHVFGEAVAATPAEGIQHWERIKQAERGGAAGRLAGVPRSLPALLRTMRLSSKAALAGFDWERDADMDAKVREEIEEFLDEAGSGDRAGMAREFGDLLFALANVARRAGIDPEAALQRTNDRFVQRFGHIERRLQASGRELDDASLDEMEALWQEAKSFDS